MRAVQIGALVLLFCSSGCWRFRRLETDVADAGAPDACVGASCGSTRVPENPLTQPASCSARKPAENPGDALCKAGTLELNCVMAPPKLVCPPSYREAAQLACSNAGHYLAYCNACGGTTVRLMLGAFDYAMHYDADDQLVGVTVFDDDPVGPCEQREFVFGRHCSETEPAAELTVSCEGTATGTI
jgi:hypothetical protein